MGDEEDWMNCPYNPNHRMPSSRFQWHLVKCPDKKKVGHLYQPCPYNAQHIVLKSELSHHKSKCPDRDDSNNTESDEIDRQIREYLAKQHHQSSQWNEPSNPNSWAPAPHVIVGEYIEQKQDANSSDSKLKNQKRNAARRNKKHNEENLETPSNGHKSEIVLEDSNIDNWEQRVSEKQVTTKSVQIPAVSLDSKTVASTTPPPYSPIMDLTTFKSTTDSKKEQEEEWSTVTKKKNLQQANAPYKPPGIPTTTKPSKEHPPKREQTGNGDTQLEEVHAGSKEETLEQKNAKKLKNCQKLLKQIADLEEKVKKGLILNEDQQLKMNRKTELEEEIKHLTIG